MAKQQANLKVVEHPKTKARNEALESAVWDLIEMVADGKIDSVAWAVTTNEGADGNEGWFKAYTGPSRLKLLGLVEDLKAKLVQLGDEED